MRVDWRNLARNVGELIALWIAIALFLLAVSALIVPGDPPYVDQAAAHQRPA